jgi:putative PIN family toxin of toxin-antitoxin system
MRIVLDTNVVVSGFLNPHHAPGLILQYIASGEIHLLYDARILAEYREVLRRPAFSLPETAISDFLDEVEAEGFPTVARPTAHRLSDRDDEPFLEVALTGKADYLVTGNLKHFPARSAQGVRVIAPRQFIDILRRQS